MSNWEAFQNAQQAGYNNCSSEGGSPPHTRGASDKAHQTDRISKCDPARNDEELSAVWNSGSKISEKVQEQVSYTNPDDYDSNSKTHLFVPMTFASGCTRRFGINTQSSSDIRERDVLAGGKKFEANTFRRYVNGLQKVLISSELPSICHEKAGYEICFFHINGRLKIAMLQSYPCCE